MVEKISLQHLLQLRSAFTDAYWIWDLNHSVDENEALHAEGFRVLGGGPHAYTVEHDRKACLDFVGRHGLEAPPSLDFARPSDAINCCAQHAGTAYEYKPDSGLNFQTFLPESEDPAEANHELEMHLRWLIENGTTNQSFLLQERKEGIEPMWKSGSSAANRYLLSWVWSARRNMCSIWVNSRADYVFTIPLKSRAVALSVGKLFPAYREMQFPAALHKACFENVCDGRFRLRRRPAIMCN